VVVAHSLSDATCRVLGLLGQGLTANEVAARLGMATGEVRSHLAHAIVELGVSSKLEAIVRAAQFGLICVGGP
jgi:two-component system, NarL family, response regulator DesR